MSLRSATFSVAVLLAATPLAALAQTTTSTTVTPPVATLSHSTTSQTTTKHSEGVEPARRVVHRRHAARHRRPTVAHPSATIEKSTTVTPVGASTSVKQTETLKK